MEEVGEEDFAVGTEVVIRVDISTDISLRHQLNNQVSNKKLLKHLPFLKILVRKLPNNSKANLH